jgi:hypothetical protein
MGFLVRSLRTQAAPAPVAEGARARSRRVLLLVAFAVACAWSAARAEPPPGDPLDLTFAFPGRPDTWIRPGVQLETAWFTGFGAWGGDAEENIGAETHGFGEIGIVPAVDAQISLGRNGTLTGRLSGVFTATPVGLDWGGSNFIDGKVRSPKEVTLEDLFLRWTSGRLLPSLGEDALDLSVGAQPYRAGPGDVGEGFLFYTGGSDGGSRGGYWLGLREAFELTAIARLSTGPFQGEAVFLRSDDLDGDHTHIAGANVEVELGAVFGLPLLAVGAGYWNVFDSDDERRDGLDVFDLRLDVQPIGALPGLRLIGEGVKESNGARNDSWGAWGEIGYDFGAHDCPWAPYASYRHAYFSGDAAGGDDTAFDPLFYGTSDWNYWTIGEIAGEWVTGNSNFQASIVRLRASPSESVTAQLFWMYQRLDHFPTELAAPGGRPVDPRAAAITDKDLSHEVDLVVDWAVNDHLSVSFVAAVLVPLKGGEEFFGRDDAWGEFMLYTSLSF